SGGSSSKALSNSWGPALSFKKTPIKVIPADPRKQQYREVPDRAVALVPSSHLAIERRLKMGASSILRICTIIGEIGKYLKWQAYCLQTLPSGSICKFAPGWARSAYETPQNQTSKLARLLCFPPTSGSERLLHHFHQCKVELSGLALLQSPFIRRGPHMLILSLDFMVLVIELGAPEIFRPHDEQV
ncbi:hypothetical protein BD779DRAFT_1528183, partial [Infundibulicybe gibba]